MPSPSYPSQLNVALLVPRPLAAEIRVYSPSSVMSPRPVRVRLYTPPPKAPATLREEEASKDNAEPEVKFNPPATVILEAAPRVMFVKDVVPVEVRASVPPCTFVNPV